MENGNTYYKVSQRIGREWVFIGTFAERTATAIYIGAFKKIDPDAEFIVSETRGISPEAENMIKIRFFENIPDKSARALSRAE